MDITTQQLQQKYKTKKHNAKRLGHEFSLSFEQFKTLFQEDYCYYTKEKMTLGLKNNEQKPTDITIDRVNNHIGYVQGNVVACTSAFNKFKAQFEISKYAKEHPYYCLMVNGMDRFLNTNKTNKVPLKKYSWLSLCE